MNIEFYRPLWGRDRSFEKMAGEMCQQGFAGFEGHLPEDPDELKSFQNECRNNNLKYVGEICTGGAHPDAYWVPDRKASVEDHLNDFESELQRILRSELDIPFINCMGGLDAWSIDEACRFFEKAMMMSEKAGCLVSFETHRTRCFYAPWTTARILNELPEIPITADLSHWCVVAERLIDDEPGLDAIIPRVKHIHGRVGYDQGPQVPDPAAPEYAEFVEAHQRWWERIWLSQLERSFSSTTLCPEYGPDGYLHTEPYSQKPVADLWQIMMWVASSERKHFESFININEMQAGGQHV